MPEPKRNETKDEFIPRCISFIKNEGKYTAEGQPSAICFSKWDNHVKKESIKEKISYRNIINEQEIFYVDKGLTPEEARKLTISKLKKDHRGFNYNSKTGKCIYI